MWESDMPTKKDGWCGALTLPRVLTLGKNNKILMNPVDELELLRETEIDNFMNKAIAENESYTVKTNEKLMELEVKFNLNSSSAQTFGLKINGSNEDETVLTYNSEISKLILDCSKCGKEKDGTRSANLEKGSELSLRIFIDRSSIEVFINGGEATITSRIYPKGETESIELFTNVGNLEIEAFKAWKLKDTWA